MKKVIALMLGLVAGTASFAQQATPQTPATSIPQTRLVVTADQKIKLYVQPLSTKGQLVLQDAQGHPLYTTAIALQEEFGQQFDVSNLPIGTYQLMITTGTQTVTKTFVVQPIPAQTFIVQQA